MFTCRVFEPAAVKELLQATIQNQQPLSWNRCYVGYVFPSYEKHKFDIILGF